MRICLTSMLGAVLGAAVAVPGADAAPDRWFGIQAVDRQTGRGIPLVELTSVSKLVFVTDSNGWVAIREPGWEGQSIYFHVRSHGYTCPADGFGYAGQAVTVTPGGRARILLDRINLAERLCRLTGDGIYRDSLLLGEAVPLAKPVLNARVFGQDSVHATPYRGRLFWLWGDTDRSDYPLGSFRTSSATSSCPGQGGLDPANGVDFTYFADATGFAKRMCPFPGIPGGLVWLGGLVAVLDAAGQERLVAEYATLDGLDKLRTRGVCVFSDAEEVFVPVKEVGVNDWRRPVGHPARLQDGGREMVLFAPDGPFPTVRTAASYEAVCAPETYEAFTCIEDGTVFSAGDTRLRRDAAGRLDWRWTAAAPPLSPAQERQLVEMGVMTATECRYRVVDAATGDLVQAHGGSCFRNDFLQGWVTILVQQFGRPSFLGEVWIAAAAAPTGPWTSAVRVVTHDAYSFYNPTQHPFFDQDGGRRIFFEGTYVNTFSNNPVRTPRYDYNQILYGLDLADPRLDAIRPERPR